MIKYFYIEVKQSGSKIGSTEELFTDFSVKFSGKPNIEDNKS